MKSLFKSLLTLTLAAAMTLSVLSVQAETLEGVGNGRNGEIHVTVTCDNDRITAVEVTAHSETPGVSDAALSDIPAAIVSVNGTNVDIVAGATATSEGILEAVNNALGNVSETQALASLISQVSSEDGSLYEGNMQGDWELTAEAFKAAGQVRRDKYAPEVRVMENGVRVQRTPNDRNGFNVKYYESDDRGCGACHTDLAGDLMRIENFTQSSYWGHHDLRNELGIELTYLQCYSCHKHRADDLSELSTIIHTSHSNSAEFNDMGGNCWSCHFVDEVTGDFVFWDEVKYDVLKGIVPVANVEGTFSYDQDKLTSNVFALSSIWWGVESELIFKDFSGVEPDPENDGIYDQFEITVTGKVENPTTWTLRELIETAPSETHIGTYECEINGFGAPLIESFEYTGIPISWLIEQAKPQEDANAFKNEEWGGPWSYVYSEKFPSYLVYEINGKPLSYKGGYPVMQYNADGAAGSCIKNVNTIELVTMDDPMMRFTSYHGGGYKLEEEATTHHPNVGICNFTEGQVIPVGEPYTFEGYAFGTQWGIDAIEFSMDNGETWTRFDTTDSTDGKWLYWNFTWTPEEEGAYVLSVRAFGGDGRTFDFPNRKLFNAQ